MSIGEAEGYRWYWRRSWDANGVGKPDAGAPAWLGPSNPDWPGNYKVRYWKPDWQKLVYDYVDRVLAAGYDGVYLDIVDAYEYWGPGDPAASTAEAEMVDFVKSIAAYARVTHSRPGSEVFVHPDYVRTVRVRKTSSTTATAASLRRRRGTRSASSIASGGQASPFS